MSWWSEATDLLYAICHLHAGQQALHTEWHIQKWSARSFPVSLLQAEVSWKFLILFSFQAHFFSSTFLMHM